MNDKDIKELIDRGDRTAFLLGKVTGGISCVLQAFNHDVVSAEEQLHKVFRDLIKSIDAIYYNHKDKNDE